MRSCMTVLDQRGNAQFRARFILAPSARMGVPTAHGALALKLIPQAPAMLQAHLLLVRRDCGVQRVGPALQVH